MRRAIHACVAACVRLRDEPQALQSDEGPSKTTPPLCGRHALSQEVEKTGPIFPFMEHKRPLQSISDHELLRRLAELMQQSRRVESDLVAHIGELCCGRTYVA